MRDVERSKHRLTSEVTNLDPLGSDDRLIIPLEVFRLFPPQGQSNAVLRLVHQCQISLCELPYRGPKISF